jgi:hypothetical protein
VLPAPTGDCPLRPQGIIKDNDDKDNTDDNDKDKDNDLQGGVGRVVV